MALELHLLNRVDQHTEDLGIAMQVPLNKLAALMPTKVLKLPALPESMEQMRRVAV
jgi:hypothetical protein